MTAPLDSYDELPYPNTPFPDTHPVRLSLLGRLFGIATADPQQCRTLELGCAGGGNLIPLAWYMPKSHFVGVERSQRQVTAGQAMVTHLGLTNLQMVQADILDWPEEPAHYDYIIAHGLYSWTPEPVRERLLQICATALAPHGIAYISYNTLPGWRLRESLREMLLYHSRRESTASDKVTAARAFLSFLAESTAELESPGLRDLRGEISRLHRMPDSYLLHEYLAEINQPFLFREFHAAAQRFGLVHVGDADYATLFPAMLGERAAQQLERIPDPLEREQYGDFVRNRTFRQSLLCHQRALPQQEPNPAVLADFAWNSPLLPPHKLDLSRPQGQPFTTPTGEKVMIFHPLTKVVLRRLSSCYPAGVAGIELQREAQTMVQSRGGTSWAEQTDHLWSELFSLLCQKFIHPTLVAPWQEPDPMVPPILTQLALAQRQAGWEDLTGRDHIPLRLDPLAARLVDLSHGQLSRQTLTQQLITEIAEGMLSWEKMGNREPRRLREMVEKRVDELLRLFSRSGLLA